MFLENVRGGAKKRATANGCGVRPAIKQDRMDKIKECLKEYEGKFIAKCGGREHGEEA